MLGSDEILCESCQEVQARMRELFSPSELAFMLGATVQMLAQAGRMTPKQRQMHEIDEKAVEDGVGALNKILLTLPKRVRDNTINEINRAEKGLTIEPIGCKASMH